MSKKYKRSWIEDLDLEEQLKLRKINRVKTVDDTPSPHRKGKTIVED